MRRAPLVLLALASLAFLGVRVATTKMTGQDWDGLIKLMVIAWSPVVVLYSIAGLITVILHFLPEDDSETQ